MKKSVFLILYSLIFAGALGADLETSVELTALGLLTRDADGAVILGFMGKGDLSFSAVANQNVKAMAELAAVWSGSLVTSPADILKRLYVKADFGGPVLLAGKARVSWGEGFVFNAGDVVFGSLLPVADLSANLLRDQTDWLIDLSLPLGPFTYIEAVLLPYSPLATSGFPYTTVYDLRFGGRFATNLGGLKIETGYLFKADEAANHPYLSLQGNLFFDFNLSASLKIPAINYTDERLKQGFALSAGLFRMFQLGGGSTLTVRLEAACRPFGLWEEPSLPSAADAYGLLLYPEVAFSPLDAVMLGLRAMINPIDASGLVALSVNFGVYQGLDVVGYLWTMWGDADDLYFGFDRQGDLGISFGLSFIY